MFLGRTDQARSLSLTHIKTDKNPLDRVLLPSSHNSRVQKGGNGLDHTDPFLASSLLLLRVMQNL